MDLTAIWTRVRDVLKDVDKKFIADSEITAWANEAQLDIAARLNLLQDDLVGTMGDGQSNVANGTLTLPASLLDATSLRLGADDDVSFVDDATFNAWKDAAQTPVVTIGRIFEDKIELYPKPVSGTAYALRYERTPAALAVGADVPEVPEHLHIKLVNYARAYAKLKMNEEGQSDRYFALYAEGLLAPATGRERLIPGPLSLIPELGPWDDVDARH